MVQGVCSDWKIVSFDDRFDSTNFERLRIRIEQILSSEDNLVVLDFSQLKYLSISAIRFVTYTAKYLKLKKGQLALVGPSDRICRHIEVYGTMENIRVFKSCQEILKAGTSISEPRYTEVLPERVDFSLMSR